MPSQTAARFDIGHAGSMPYDFVKRSATSIGVPIGSSRGLQKSTLAGVTDRAAMRGDSTPRCPDIGLGGDRQQHIRLLERQHRPLLRQLALQHQAGLRSRQRASVGPLLRQQERLCRRVRPERALGRFVNSSGCGSTASRSYTAWHDGCGLKYVHIRLRACSTFGCRHLSSRITPSRDPGRFTLPDLLVPA